MVLAVAEKLGKFAHEVAETLTDAELAEWGEFWKWQSDEREKAAKKARARR